MIYREASDQRQADIAKLKALREKHKDQNARNRIDTQLNKIRAGMKGEEEVAHFLRSAYTLDPDVHVLHDLRFETPGGVAQIDHAVITRQRGLYLLETKSMRDGIMRDKEGLWWRTYGKVGEKSRRRMNDPIEQGRRHVDLVSEMMSEWDVINITQIVAVMIVMSDAEVTFERQQHEDFHVVTADQFKTWLAGRTAARFSTTQPQEKKKREPLDTDQMHGISSRLEREHRPVSYDWTWLTGVQDDPAVVEAKALPMERVFEAVDEPSEPEEAPAPAEPAEETKEDKVRRQAKYVNQYVRRHTIQIDDGLVTVFEHEDGMHSLRTEGPKNVRRNMSLLCTRVCDGRCEWIEENSSWLLTADMSESITATLIAQQSEAADRPAPPPSAPVGPKLPGAAGPSVRRSVNGRKDLTEYTTEDGLVRFFRLPEKNYVIRTDANEMNDVRIASVCNEYGVGEYYEQRNNWLIPQHPPELIERVARAILAFKHERVDTDQRRRA